jgi:hypothetical protein
MKIRRRAAWVLSVGLSLALTPSWLYAQGGTATTGTGTGSTGATGGTGGTGGAAASGASAVATSAVNISQSSGLVQPMPILAITNTGSSATTTPSTSNPFYYTYVNPSSLGLPSIYATNLGPPTKYTGTMGKGLYITTVTTSNSTTASTTTNAGVGFSTQPTPRAPAYYTVLGEGLTPKAYSADKVSAELTEKFANSSYFKKGDAIQVQVASNGVVLLRGQVATESERIRAEGMIRITRGVNDVQNELQVVPGKN